MKKSLAVLLCIAVLLSFAACTKAAEETNTTTTEAPTSSVTNEVTSETTTVNTTEKATETTKEKTTEKATETTKEKTTTKKVTTTKKETTTKKTTTTTKKTVSGDVFALSYKGAKIKPNQKMSSVLKKIGNPSSAPEKLPSCMDNGYDLLYDYKSFIIETFCNEKGKETIINIEITSSSVQLDNSIKVGMKTKDAIELSGLTFKDYDGIYVYTKGDYEISLYDDGGKIEQIFIESTKY